MDHRHFMLFAFCAVSLVGLFVFVGAKPQSTGDPYWRKALSGTGGVLMVLGGVGATLGLVQLNQHKTKYQSLRERLSPSSASASASVSVTTSV